MRATGRLLIAMLMFAALQLRAGEVTLVSPRAGATLEGGRQTTVAWRGATLPKEAEEWEAFLSVDGGASFAYRVTPHLDLAHDRFTFEVPNVDTDDARILIRVGDEHRETEFLVPASFRIERDPLRALASPHLEVLDEERGESAREGERGVIGWVEGDRHGEHVAVRTAARNVATLRDGGAHLTDTSHDTAAVASSASIAAPSVTATVAAPAALTRHEPLAIHRSGRDVLLVSSRLNI